MAKDEHLKTLQILNSSLSGRDINANLFSHEIHSSPPSLSQKWEIFHGTKAHMFQCLESEILSSLSQPQVDALISIVPAILHMIGPGLSVPIEENIHTKVHPYSRVFSSLGRG